MKVCDGLRLRRQKPTEGPCRNDLIDCGDMGKIGFAHARAYLDRLNTLLSRRLRTPAKAFEEVQADQQLKQKA